MNMIPRFTVRDHDDMHVLLAAVEVIGENVRKNLAELRDAKAMLAHFPEEMRIGMSVFADRDEKEGEMLAARVDGVLAELREMHAKMVADKMPLSDPAGAQAYHGPVSLPNDGANTPPLDPTLN